MTLNLTEGTPATLAKGTLGRQLVVRVAAIVAVVSILLSTAAFVAVRQIMVSKADQQLAAIAGRPQRGGDDTTRTRGPAGLPVGGILITLDSSGEQTGQILTDSNVLASLSSAAVQKLIAFRVTPGRFNVRLDELGNYRVLVTQNPSGQTFIVAIPLGDVDHAVSQMLLWLLAFTLLAIAAAILLTRYVLARSLRPLHEVAQVAAEVSRRELDRGEVDLSLRVPDTKSSPNNEVGRVGLALNTMLSNVEAALEARQASETKVRQFVADASHELRNPLAAIRGYAELTRRGRADLPEDTQFAMSRIESESERMSRLVEDMLLLARLDNGPALTLAPIDLTEVVVNAVADAQVAGPEHDWDVDVPEDSLLVQADRYRLHQVVANLLANARTHTPPGSHVTTTVSVDGAYAVVTVVDDGPGIPAEILPTVFERFVRADASRARKKGQSTGLGLAIVAAVINAHGGAVTVTSRPGRTAFEVRLRRA